MTTSPSERFDEVYWIDGELLPNKERILAFLLQEVAAAERRGREMAVKYIKNNSHSIANEGITYSVDIWVLHGARTAITDSGVKE